MGAADYLASLDAEVERLLAEGRTYDAVRCLDGALGVVARTPGDAIAAGTRLMRQRDMEGALRHFNGVIAEHFAHDHARYGKALALRALGRAVEAEAELRRAVELAEDRRRSLADAPDGPIYGLYMKHELLVRWAHIADLPLYHLALGDARSAERAVREAIAQAPAPLLAMLHSRLADFAAIAMDNVKVRSLRRLLGRHTR